MVPNFVWWAVIWFLEMDCGAQDKKTFQLHLGTVSQICSWWKLLQFHRQRWSLCCMELSIRKAGTVNSSFSSTKKKPFFQMLEEVFHGTNQINRTGPLTDLVIWVLSWVPVGISSFTLARKSASFSHQALSPGLPCKDRETRGTLNAFPPAWAAKWKLFWISHNISEIFHNNHWSPLDRILSVWHFLFAFKYMCLRTTGCESLGFKLSQYNGMMHLKSNHHICLFS